MELNLKVKLVEVLNECLCNIPSVLITLIADYYYLITIKYSGSYDSSVSGFYYVHNDIVFYFGNRLMTISYFNNVLLKSINYKEKKVRIPNLILRHDNQICCMEYVYHCDLCTNENGITFIKLCTVDLNTLLVSTFKGSEVSYKIQGFYTITNYKNMVYLLTKNDETHDAYFQVLNPCKEEKVKIINIHDFSLRRFETHYVQMIHTKGLVQRVELFITTINKNTTDIFYFALKDNHYELIKKITINSSDKINFDAAKMFCYIENNIIYIPVIEFSKKNDLREDKLISGILTYNLITEQREVHLFDEYYLHGMFIDCHTSDYFILKTDYAKTLCKFTKQVA